MDFHGSEREAGPRSDEHQGVNVRTARVSMQLPHHFAGAAFHFQFDSNRRTWQEKIDPAEVSAEIVFATVFHSVDPEDTSEAILKLRLSTDHVPVLFDEARQFLDRPRCPGMFLFPGRVNAGLVWRPVRVDVLPG